MRVLFKRAKIKKMSQKISLRIRVLRKIIYYLACMDHGFKSLVQIILKKEYVRVGSCNQCGKCCESIGFEVDRTWLEVKWLKKWMVAWVSKIHNMKYRGCDDDGQYGLLLFRCNYLGPDGLCQNYENRPLFCRTYPQVNHYFLHPVFYPDCSYQAVKRSDLKQYQKSPQTFFNSKTSDDK